MKYFVITIGICIFVLSSTLLVWHFANRNTDLIDPTELHSYSSPYGYNFRYTNSQTVISEESSVLIMDAATIQNATYLISIGPIWTPDSAETLIEQDTFINKNDLTYTIEQVAIHEKSWVKLTGVDTSPVGNPVQMYYLENAPLNRDLNPTQANDIKSHLQVTLTVLKDNTLDSHVDTLYDLVSSITFSK